MSSFNNEENINLSEETQRPETQTETPDFTLEDFKNGGTDELAFTKELFDYLSAIGFKTSGTEMEEFLSLMGQADEFSADSIESVLRPLIVKSGKEDREFHDTMGSFFKIQKSNTEKKTGFRNELEQKEEKLRETELKKEELEKKYREASDITHYLSEEEYGSISESQTRRDFIGLASEYAPEQKELLEEIDGCAAGHKSFSKERADDLISALQRLLKKAILHPNAKNIMDYIADEIALVKKMCEEKKTEKETIGEEYEKTVQETEKIENEISTIKDRLNDTDVKEIYKGESLRHREEFIGGKNAVHSDGEGEIVWMEKQFGNLAANEKRQMREYIRDNKNEFRSRLSRYIKGSQRKEIDIPATCRMSFQTGGVPMRLAFKKPDQKRAKILLILDISGSCSAASELMLTFMYYMKECIPGGCLTYVFINQLYDVTKIFDESYSPEDAIQNIMQTIKRAGVYSDYGKTFKQFYDTEMSKINSSRTFTFFIGDARNNKNESGEEYFGKICRKSQRAIWLNTEPKEKWNTVDSIIGIYGKYVDAVKEVTTPGDMFSLFTRDVLRNGSAV